MSFAPLPIGGLGSHLARTTAQFNAMQPMQFTGSVQFTQPTLPSQAVGGVQSFQAVLGDTLQSLNTTVQAPEGLMHQAMSGGPADIHDVVMASTQAELAVTLTTNAMTKILQAYERISQIQV